jgi:gamma-glutamyltranspeptidase/glutathione hydrolase
LQANRLAFADRNLYVADPDFVKVPTTGLIDPTYLAARSALITDGAVAPTPVTAGTPPAAGITGSPDPSPPNFGGTSHVSIVDRFGNVLSQTITVESPFGNNRMVDGFILNNELTDFSFAPGPDSAPIANRVEGGKRPRSSMSPTIVFMPEGEPVFATGSPGGASIIGTTTQSLLALIDFGLDPQQAANQAHFQNNNSNPTILETLFSPTIPPGQPGGAPAGTTGVIGPFDVRSLAPQLQALGWVISPNPTVLTSGLNIVKIGEEGIEGGSDPRREGIAAGR